MLVDTIPVTQSQLDDCLCVSEAIMEMIEDEADPDRPGAAWRRANRALYRLMPSCPEDDPDAIEGL